MKSEHEPIAWAQGRDIVRHGNVVEARIARKKLGIAALDPAQRVKFAARILVRDGERSFRQRPFVHLTVSSRNAETESGVRRQNIHAACLRIRSGVQGE